MPQEEIDIDVRGEVVRVPREVVHALAAAAAARAGISSRHRDLSLVLGRALDSGRVSLSRVEVRALRAVLEEGRNGYGPAGEELLRVANA